MESAYVNEHKTLIHELSQGIQMAKQLRVNLNSSETREFLIHKILSSYENALFVLKSADFSGQPPAAAPPAPSLPESSISIGSPQSREFKFDHFDQPFFSANTNATIPSSFSIPSTPFDFNEDYQQLNNFSNHFDDELLQVHSQQIISPETSESNYFTLWGSSPSPDFAADVADVNPNFKFNSSFF